MRTAWTTVLAIALAGAQAAGAVKKAPPEDTRNVQQLRAVIHLNGTPILRAEPGPWRGYAKIDLPATALRLLRKGANVLAVRAERGSRDGTFDVGLEGLPRRPRTHRT